MAVQGTDTPPRRRSVGPTDAIWLNADRPNNPMAIVALIFLESVPDWDRVTEVLRERLVLRYPVFRQRPTAARTPFGRQAWETDPDFCVDAHVQRFTLDPPGDDAVLQAHVETYVHRLFDRHHPLWEVHLLEGYGTGAVLFCRVHHALADGIALTQVLFSLTDEQGPDRVPDREATDEALVVGTGEATAARAAGRAPRQGLLEQPSRLAGLAGGIAAAGLRAGLRLGTPAGVADAAGLAARTTKVVRDLLFAATPPSVVVGTPGPAKRVVWTAPAPQARLKAVGRLSGATLNDVLMSALAGALHRYQLEHGQVPTDHLTMVPVNVRPLDQPLPAELGNRFALVFFALPSSRPGPLDRLAETKRRMDWLKRSPEASITLALMAWLGRIPAAVGRPVVDFFADKAIGVTTNVAGPRARRVLAGVPVTSVLGWVPGSGNQTVGACIFTYAGTVRVGFMVDAGVVPDPQALLTAFERELAVLSSLGRVGGKAAKGAR